jgi:hypothetical protein
LPRGKIKNDLTIQTNEKGLAKESREENEKEMLDIKTEKSTAGFQKEKLEGGRLFLLIMSHEDKL